MSIIWISLNSPFMNVTGVLAKLESEGQEIQTFNWHQLNTKFLLF